MASSRLNNPLLFVIALCLVLIVVHLYSGHLVAKAYADTTSVPSAPKGADAVVLYGCYHADPKAPCDWKPVQVSEYGLLRTTTK